MYKLNSIPDGAWIAIQVCCNSENRVSACLEQRSYERFLPMHQADERSRGRSVSGNRPLFPGYLFCRWSQSNPNRIVQIPGVIRLVGLKRTPIPVDEAEIDAVRRVVDSRLAATTCALSSGTWVRIESGPLRGIRGVVSRRDGISYFVVNVALLHRAVAVRVHQADLECAKPSLEIDSRGAELFAPIITDSMRVSNDNKAWLRPQTVNA